MRTAALRPELENPACLALDLGESLCLARRDTDRLLKVERLPRLHGLDADVTVRMIRCRHKDGVDIVAADGLAEILHLGGRASSHLRDNRRRIIQRRHIDIAKDGDLAILQLCEAAHHLEAPPARTRRVHNKTIAVILRTCTTDHAQAHLLRRRRRAEKRTDGRNGERTPAGLDEIPSVHVLTPFCTGFGALLL